MKTLQNNHLNKQFILRNKHSECGIVIKNYILSNEFGNGNIIEYSFDGLKIQQIKLQLKKSLQIQKSEKNHTLALSVLIEGEKKISDHQQHIEIIQESIESCISPLRNINYTIEYSKEKKIKELVISMATDFVDKHRLNDLISYEKNSTNECLTQQLSDKTYEIVNEIFKDTKKGLLKRLFFEAKVLELLSLQYSEIKEQKSSSKKILKAKNIITNNLDRQISINEISKRIYLNEFLLKKEFKEIIGKSIFEFAQFERMKEAKRLLKNTVKPIYEIAELVGYKNHTHFTAAFKKLEQKTPKMYRKEF